DAYHTSGRTSAGPTAERLLYACEELMGCLNRPFNTVRKRLLWLYSLCPDLEDEFLDQWVRREHSREGDTLLFEELIMDNLGQRVVFSCDFHCKALLIFSGSLNLQFLNVPSMSC